MTDIEKQALALVNEVRAERGQYARYFIDRAGPSGIDEAICRALEMLNAEREAHAAYKQEVSDAVAQVLPLFTYSDDFQRVEAIISRFIIKPPVDPLYDAIKEVVEMGRYDTAEQTILLRQALAARGGRIVFDGGE